MSTVNEKMTALADAIREKTGETGLLTIDEMTESVQNKIGDGVALPDLTNAGTAPDLIEGKELIDADGNVIVGTMPDSGAINSTMDGITTKSIAVPAGYTSGGTVSLDDTIDNEVATQADLIDQILVLIESKMAHNTIHVGSTEPTNDIGINGDIYVMRGGSA